MCGDYPSFQSLLFLKALTHTALPLLIPMEDSSLLSPPFPNPALFPETHLSYQLLIMRASFLLTKMDSSVSIFQNLLSEENLKLIYHKL